MKPVEVILCQYSYYSIIECPRKRIHVPTYYSFYIRTMLTSFFIMNMGLFQCVCIKFNHVHHSKPLKCIHFNIVSAFCRATIIYSTIGIHCTQHNTRQKGSTSKWWDETKKTTELTERQNKDKMKTKKLIYLNLFTYWIKIKDQMLNLYKLEANLNIHIHWRERSWDKKVNLYK